MKYYIREYLYLRVVIVKTVVLFSVGFPFGERERERGGEGESLEVCMAAPSRSSSSTMRNLLPPQELLDDLCRVLFSSGSQHECVSPLFDTRVFCSRFVLNVPKEDLESFERILFLLEQAHWFYEDNSVEQNPSLKSLSFREFTSLSIL
ncbi:hypothetical protein ZIOFF_074881 [Zingiber officinale]|uniref:mRNA decapping protein 2 Box A domain-containing protein n=1 Tax=Zingiber officinale TaxID=94328 RepID=A0A8J5ERV6_ZINOF|nr:hypothetical protein ZIOFF_074881 [Zingiber officinale]